MSNKHKNPTISFRITDAERKQIEAQILASGMIKKDYFVRSCIYNHICVVGKKETIHLCRLPTHCTCSCCKCKRLSQILTGISISSPLRKRSPHYRPTRPICFLQALICQMVPGICGKETDIKNNHLNYQFGMYDPSTDSVIVNTSENSVLVIRCQECNATIILNEPNDIVYLSRLAQETSLLYAELALKEDGLQGYVSAMSCFY